MNAYHWINNVCEKILPIEKGTRSNKISFAVGVVLDDTLEASASAPSESENINMKIIKTDSIALLTGFTL